MIWLDKDTVWLAPKAEGTERDSALIAAEWHDDWIMGILEHDHRNGGRAQG